MEERVHLFVLVGEVCLGCSRARYRRPSPGFISCSSLVQYWDSLDWWHGCEHYTVYNGPHSWSHRCQAHKYDRLKQGQTILQKKSQGCLIHVSDFINEETGQLILLDSDGEITRDAHKIIYPGSNGDAWWDTEQLLAQMVTAIEIFNEAHPNCVALFIFDQSSAHASLGPGALHAWNMNKGNGGKQPIQKDTIIPQSNPVVEHRGKLQSMKTDDGLAKGLQQTLEE